MKKYVVGYTQGVFDMFHIGHLRLINHSAEMCERLIVGVNSDALVQEYKNKTPVIDEIDRAEIIRNLKSVFRVEIVDTLDKEKLFQEIGFDAVFIGDDWKGTARWNETEETLKKYGVDVVYLPYTKNVSSTGLRDKKGVEEIGMDNEIKIGEKNNMEYVVDKNFCMSSYLAFRFVVDEYKVFKEGVTHKDHIMVKDDNKHPVRTSDDIDRTIKELMADRDLSNAGVLLSGGIDSAIVASYMPKGTKAYTSRCLGENAIDETEQAKRYCDKYDLEHVIVDVSWEDYNTAMDELAAFQGSPVIPNEPQAYKIVKQAKVDGVKTLVHGDTADIEFGGMSKMMERDWTLSEWVERSIYIRPEKVLKDPTDIYYIYDKYKKTENMADYEAFIKEIYGRATAGALTLACRSLDLSFFDPFEEMRLTHPLDINRIRSGDSKYLIRDLFRKRYPGFDVPEKIPMGRPADAWLKKWGGCKREEFVPGCADNLSGEQRLLLYSLERFLDIIEA